MNKDINNVSVAASAVEKAHSGMREIVAGEGVVMNDLSEKVRFALRIEMK